MRLKPGRPDIAAYQNLFTVPTAEGEFSVTWLGVSTLLIEDGNSALMTDGYFSRPGLAAVGLGRITPSQARVDGCLLRAGVTNLDAVIPVHTHFDHVLDSALVADRTGAKLVGSRSARQVGLGHGLPEDRLDVVCDGERRDFGNFRVTFIESEHCPPDRFPGTITAPVRPPARASTYRCGPAWSLLVHHLPTDRHMLIQGSAGFRAQSLVGQRAEVAYLGLGQLGLQPTEYLRQYWAEAVTAVGARTVVGIHWDDFFTPLDKPIRALPYAGDDLDRTLRVFGELAAADGVNLALPTVWERADPWR